MSEEIKNFQLVEEKTSHSQTFLEFEKEFLSLQDFALDIVSFSFENVNNLQLVERIKQSANLASIIKEAYDRLIEKGEELLSGENERAKIDLTTMYEIIKNFYDSCVLLIDNISDETQRNNVVNALEELDVELKHIQN